MIGGRRTGESVSVDRLESALERWEYRTSPTAAAALATDLRDLFPAADVSRPGAGSEADVVVGGVAIRFVEELGRRFRTDLHVLADHYDGVVCYSTSCHRESPSAWRSITHHHRSESLRFVTGTTAGTGAPDAESASAATVVLVPIVMLALGVLLAASTGLFTTDASALSGEAGLLLGAVAVAAVVASLAAFGLTRQRRVRSVLSRLAQ